ncbi:MAG: prolyl oligopeptidase family serine peptidase [Brevibacterium sp.]|nr:prolyl oligopeptidase family serine peptidase [Brevibacterium sp.]MDN5834554.1 prolyl oligopeptidase family serine peptidase [Brevibacterium sp.]MDN5910209.1 prolyl oligopeptidase family serine peptidase [Brevibacterium sp.]MDN6158857.1 prolyl oligopeptidase family serine peptidase [Brevibacterium sp.]MDN6190060.1 prolyl oligopeptidase family serine peptidase [Brevibacterium sp.]
MRKEAPADNQKTDTSSAATVPRDAAPMPHDENLWLEDIHGDDQMAWVREQNAKTIARFQDDLFDSIAGDIQTALDSEGKIPMVAKRGDDYFNFWRDTKNPKGMWRRTTWDSYVSDSPQWEVLIDLDELGAAEATPWVWAGASVRRSDNSRALVSLSPDGGDAHRVREFDLRTKSFVVGGFDLPSAKTRFAWLDDDTIIVATETDEDSLTTSSYPRQARVLTRGQAIADAPIVAEVPREHVAIFVGSDVGPADSDATDRVFAIDAIDFFNSRPSFIDLDMVTDESGSVTTDASAWEKTWTLVDVPTDVEVGFDRDFVLFRPQSEWNHGDFSIPAGALAVADIAEVRAGTIAPTVIFSPDAHTALQSWTWTRDYLVLELLADVQSQLVVLDPNDNFSSSRLPGVPANHMVGLGAVDRHDDTTANDYWLVSTGFLTPSTLSYGRLEPSNGSEEAGGADTARTTNGYSVPEIIKSAPALFPSEGFSVEQHFATSEDGTKIPYFQIADNALVLDGSNPTLLDGYGGFEVSRSPVYSPVMGVGWLGRTTTAAGRPTIPAGRPTIPAGRRGVYVLANIRGGGEYGPQWHTSAMRENRMRAYEDYAAVARDLIERGVTSPKSLACAGGSNGGLLVGNMLTQHPELFGAISCGVPLLDMRRYTKLSAGYSWKAEYGDPDVAEDWAFIQKFSPYHLLEEGADYPPVLFWTATSDDRVGPVQARKMAARMQGRGISDVWFFEDTEGGHSAASDNKQAAFTRALSYRFLWNSLTGE